MFGFPSDLFSMSMGGNRRRLNTGNSLMPHTQGLFGSSLIMPFPLMSSPFGGSNGFFNDFASPFSMMDRMMRGASGALFENENADGNGAVHSFSSTTVMSFDGTDGRPKVYQESTSRRRGPGGIEETRQAIRDSERGINKVQIGHRIGDRKHVVEREMNVQTGQISENVELENLDEEEAESFQKEWRERSARVGFARRANRHLHPPLTSDRLHHSSSETGRAPLAIEYNPRQRSSNESTVKRTDTIDLTEETNNDDDVKEIEQVRSTKRKASSSSISEIPHQRKHRHHGS